MKKFYNLGAWTRFFLQLLNYRAFAQTLTQSMNMNIDEDSGHNLDL